MTMPTQALWTHRALASDGVHHARARACISFTRLVQWFVAGAALFRKLGIRPADVAGFLVAQALGAASGALVFSWLVPAQPTTALTAE
jgi:hypothetical protein